MCLAVPAKVKKLSGTLAEVTMSGVTREVDVRLIEPVRPGDYVLVHAGFAIEKIDAREARKTLAVLKDIHFE